MATTRKTTAKKAPAKKAPAKKTAGRGVGRKAAAATVDTRQPGWALHLTPEQWGTFLLNGDLTPGVLSEIAQLRRPPSQPTTLQIQADLRAAMDAYMANTGASVRDLLQASVAAYLAAQGYFPAPDK